ncbi:hypothetical protein COB52_04695 [Candidatus Kaiserbacteria bacterium]|nr:MAG: hypothetical protein COB52_04695 [Candidatus Kaiserbacteria bacterium]
MIILRCKLLIKNSSKRVELGLLLLNDQLNRISLKEAIMYLFDLLTQLLLKLHIKKIILLMI